MSVASDLVDAIAADLNSNASLPTHDTIKYRRPRAIMPEDCPLMVVWFTNKEVNLEAGTTDRFDNVLFIGVSWHEESVAEAETLVNDETKSKALMTVLEKFEARTRYLSKNGTGVAAVYEVLPNGSAYVPAEMQDALVEGVVHEIAAKVSEV